METTVPSQLLPYYQYHFYIDGDQKTPEDPNLWILLPSYDSQDKDVEVPNLFVERRKGMGNDVCHVKPIPRLSITDGRRIYYKAEGLHWGVYGSSVGRNDIYFIDYYGKMAVIYNLMYDGKTNGKQRWEITVESCRFRKTNSSGYDKAYYGVADQVFAYNAQTGSYKYESGSYSGYMRYLRVVMEGLLLVGYHDHPTNPRDIPKGEMVDFILDIVDGFRPFYSALPDYLSTGYLRTMVKHNVWTTHLALPTKPLDELLVFDEYHLLFEGASLHPYAAYHLKAARQAAYLDALDHVPSLNDNSIANVLELIGFIKALVIDHRVEIPKSLQSLWLSYRYAYTTTKLDAEEAINFVHRYMGNDLTAGFSCYGSVTYDLSGVSAIVKCRISMKQRELDTLSCIWTSLYKYGLSPSFYVVWDMIPYSFIVDWFIPVGDILNGYDRTRMYDRTYDISDIWYSIKYTIHTDEGDAHAYTRWCEPTPPEFNGYYTLENKGTPSDRVIGFRILDTMSILFR